MLRGLMNDVELLLQDVGLMVLLHRLLILKNPYGISRKCQELLLMAYAIDLTGRNGPLLVTVFVVLLLSSWSKHPASSQYRRKSQDPFPHWALLILAILVGFVFVVSLPDGVWTRFATDFESDIKESGATQKEAIDIVGFLFWVKTTGELLKPLALIPQIIVFRKNPIEGFHGGVFVLVTGLARPIAAVATWAIRHYGVAADAEGPGNELSATMIEHLPDASDSLLKAQGHAQELLDNDYVRRFWIPVLLVQALTVLVGICSAWYGRDLRCRKVSEWIQKYPLFFFCCSVHVALHVAVMVDSLAKNRYPRFPDTSMMISEIAAADGNANSPRPSFIPDEFNNHPIVVVIQYVWLLCWMLVGFCYLLKILDKRYVWRCFLVCAGLELLKMTTENSDTPTKNLLALLQLAAILLFTCFCCFCSNASRVTSQDKDVMSMVLSDLNDDSLEASLLKDTKYDDVPSTPRDLTGIRARSGRSPRQPKEDPSPISQLHIQVV